MNEKLIQYIWQFQLFNKVGLITVESHPISIIQPGTLNENQGPDFLNGKIVTENTTWMGSIEIHVQSSDWEMHGHSNDVNYKNVILHVVWHHDKDLNLPFPTLELKTLVPKHLLSKYQSFQSQTHFIPCEKNIAQINHLHFEKWKETLIMERLQIKATFIKKELIDNVYNWKIVFGLLMARAFGGNLNGGAFGQIFKSVPFEILISHQHNLFTIESILMGQSGLLNEEFKDDYPNLLKKEYLFLKHKYKLTPPKISLLFLRMRPSNFPTVRLAQFASFICKNANAITAIMSLKSKRELIDYFDFETNEYWDNHYCFDVRSKPQKKRIGKTLFSNIIINAIVPFQFSYGVMMGEENFVEQSIEILMQSAPEENKIVNQFKTLNINATNAFDSQFMIQLKNEYCDLKKCLSCHIGYAILKNNQ